MSTEDEGSTTAVLPDVELEAHLASLGLATVEEYTAWCARHGFSTRVEKRWLDRCKERYYAAQHQIRARLACKKQESRHPRKTSIWSLGLERNEQRRRPVLTVEVAVDKRIICQARGKANRLPEEKEVSILRRWAAQEGLSLAEHVA